MLASQNSVDGDVDVDDGVDSDLDFDVDDGVDSDVDSDVDDGAGGHRAWYGGPRPRMAECKKFWLRRRSRNEERVRPTA